MTSVGRGGFLSGREGVVVFLLLGRITRRELLKI